jgi:hypothetical protein
MRRWFVTPVDNQMIRTIQLITNSGHLLSISKQSISESILYPNQVLFRNRETIRKGARHVILDFTKEKSITQKKALKSCL